MNLTSLIRGEKKTTDLKGALRSIKGYDAYYKIVIIGNGNVGKSTLRKWIQSGYFEDEPDQTLGADFGSTVVELPKDDGNLKVKLIMWDLSGQFHTFAPVRRQFYSGTKAIILMYSVVDRDSFEALAGWLREIKSSISEEIKRHIYLIGNKSDLRELDEIGGIPKEEILMFSHSQNLPQFEISLLEEQERGARSVHEILETLAINLWKSNQEAG